MNAKTQWLGSRKGGGRGLVKLKKRKRAQKKGEKGGKGQREPKDDRLPVIVKKFLWELMKELKRANIEKCK